MNELYAIVDIETTGGHAHTHGITEIAIIIHDGTQIIDQYETLINPFQEIPIFIQGLTGITDEMVKNAPSFKEVAPIIFSLLDQKIFVAHNVNFDYSFVHQHLKNENFLLDSKKLCTVRLARKIFPGLPSYSLGKLTRSFDIKIENRHRAGGDAFATATLFKMMLLADEHQYINEALTPKVKAAILPSFLSKEEIEKIPRQPGVYYFKNKKNEILYVGKANNLHKGILSHFSKSKLAKDNQEFLKETRKVSHQVCGTELQALILENIEMKRLWPAKMKETKIPEKKYGLYLYEDQKGYTRFRIVKKVKGMKPYFLFNSLTEAHTMIADLCLKFNLCPKLCDIQVNQEACLGRQNQQCFGACESLELAKEYNRRVSSGLASLIKDLPSYLIIDRGRNRLEKSCILMDKGSFYGMGYLSENQIPENIDHAKSVLTPYPTHQIIEKLVTEFAVLHPQKQVLLIG